MWRDEPRKITNMASAYLERGIGFALPEQISPLNTPLTDILCQVKIYGTKSRILRGSVRIVGNHSLHHNKLERARKEIRSVALDITLQDGRERMIPNDRVVLKFNERSHTAGW